MAVGAEGAGESTTEKAKPAKSLSPLHGKYNLTIGGVDSTNSHSLGLRDIQKPDSHKILDEQAWYLTYTATTALLVLVHVIYVTQFVTRKLSRRRLLVNYHRLVQKKCYHMGIRAVLSHAPTKPNSREATHISSVPYVRNFTSALLGPFAPGKPLSGLPLLFYCTHILWSCRALEVVFGSGGNYARVLWTLTWTGFVIDLGFTYAVLEMLREMNYATSLPFTMGANFWNTSPDSNRPVARRVQRALVRRSMGSLTMTAGAVLCVFRGHFDVPIPVLPFISTELPMLGIPLVSYLITLALLLVFSQPIHPISGVTFGTCVGLLWKSGFTSFLAEPYWNMGSMIVYAVLCIMGLKANNVSYLPCIDHISWNSRGDITYNPQHSGSPHGAAVAIDLSNEDHIQTSEDEYLSDTSVTEEEAPFFGLASRRPQRRRSSTSLNYSIDSDSEEGANADTLPLIASNRSASGGGTMRSRRATTGRG